MSSVMDSALANAFVELCSEKNIESITVKDVIARCGVSKQTFYNHFRDKQDLMNYVYQREVDAAVGVFSGEVRSLAGLEHIAERVLSRMLARGDYFKAIARFRTQNDFAGFFEESTRQFFLDALSNGGSKELDERTLRLIDYNSAGLAKLSMKWVLDGMPQMPRDYAKECVSCISEDLKRAVESEG